MRPTLTVSILIVMGVTAGCASSPAARPSSQNRTSSAASLASGADSSDSVTPAPYPMAGPVTSGPLGGNHCDSSRAWWDLSGAVITVQVSGPRPSLVSGQAVDASNVPVGSGTGRIDGGATGVQIRIPLTGTAAGVSMSIAGATRGTCEEKRH